MKDIDLYVLLKYNTDISPGLTKEYLKAIMHQYLGFKPFKTDKVMSEFIFHAPKNKHLIHALAAIGYSQPKIANTLGISQSGVSKHLSVPLEDEWKNIHFYRFISENEDNLLEYEGGERDIMDYLIRVGYRKKSWWME